MTADTFRSGLVALIGRPNVGKSTLLNRLVGSKVSITSHRPQTTRNRILGIKTSDDAQAVYVDTPGLNKGSGQRINRYMSRVAAGSIEGVDCVTLLISAGGWRPEDDLGLALVTKAAMPTILIINKIDTLKDRARLLPLIEQSQLKHTFAEIVPISARTGANLSDLEQAIKRYLPVQPPIYPIERVTDRSDRFLAAELVREQVFSGFGQEVPYATTVQIEQFARAKGMLRVEAIIWVEKEGQKPILIGKDGSRLKAIGTRARLAMQKLFGSKIHLSLWVKVREGWSDDARALRSFGYTED